jgi:aryl-alcohol dehydrogenase-like predicted oxidoreductase
MNYISFGRTGIKVSRLVVGSWYLPHLKESKNGVYPVDKDTSIKLIKKAYDMGINFFDTADVYRGVYDRSGKNPDFSSIGTSEKIIGEALKGYDRESFVISTKVMGRVGPLVNDSGLNRKHVKNAIKKSLERLGMDYVDIYFMHANDNITSLEEAVKTMNLLINEGKILHYGVSNFEAFEITYMYNFAFNRGLDVPSAIQDEYNLLNRGIEKTNLVVSNRYDMASMIYSPLAQGILAGRYLNKGNVISRKDYDPKFIDDVNFELNNKKVQKLNELAKTKGYTCAQLALSWLLHQGKYIFPIIGISNEEQLLDNLGAIDVSLNDEDLKSISEIFL